MFALKFYVRQSGKMSETNTDCGEMLGCLHHFSNRMTALGNWDVLVSIKDSVDGIDIFGIEA